MAKKTSVQIGFTARRAPGTGECLPAGPLYIEEDDSAKEAVKQVMEDIGNLLAQRMKAYKDGCREAGVAI